MALEWQIIISGIFGVIIGGIIMLATIICDRKKRVKKSIKEPILKIEASKIEASKTETPKKEVPKIEASKILAVWAAAVATISLILPYVLSFMDKQPVSDMTSYVFPSCIGYLITYAGKSLGEKISRNKHGLDENGYPYDSETEV